MENASQIGGMLDLITILCAGLLVGTEFAVSAFVNPAIWKLDETAQAKAIHLLAGVLGKVMPFWYSACLALFAAEAYLHRLSSGFPFICGAIAIYVCTVAFSFIALVPINTRLAKMDLAALPSHWREEHKRWDARHRVRIALLITALALLVWGDLSRA